MVFNFGVIRFLLAFIKCEQTVFDLLFRLFIEAIIDCIDFAFLGRRVIDVYIDLDLDLDLDVDVDVDVDGVAIVCLHEISIIINDLFCDILNRTHRTQCCIYLLRHCR